MHSGEFYYLSTNAHKTFQAWVTYIISNVCWHRRIEEAMVAHQKLFITKESDIQYAELEELRGLGGARTFPIIHDKSTFFFLC